MDASRNKEIAQLLKDMASMYAFLNSGNRYRRVAYERAARIVSGLEDDIGSYDQKKIEDLKGIGESIASKIVEYIRSGKIKKYEALKSMVPFDLMRLTEVNGIGPKILNTLHRELGINSPSELVRALKDGSVAGLKGFGKKKTENMLKGIELRKGMEERILLWDALEISDRIIGNLKNLKEVDKIEMAGSIRRRKETIGDLDILITCREKDRKKVIDHFTSMQHVKEVVLKGKTKISVVIEDRNRQVDLRIVEADEWGAALVYFTGSKQHNVHIRTIAREKKLKVSEYGIFATGTNKRFVCKTEEDVYKKLGMQWMPPEIREDNGEVEAALKHKIPDLVEESDIMGDLQMHSDWSDGRHSLGELARYLKKHFHYQYIAVTDHSKSLRIAGGMDEEAFMKQIDAIRALNNELGEDFVKTGIEADIHTDGTLDMSDEVLGRLDWVVASIHTRFNRDNTERLVKACENPYVHVIGHPSGRLIGTREAYKVDMNRVIEAAKATGTALEINAQPERMDLNDQYARAARDKGVKLVISTDGHVFGNFNCMKLGVAIARRAWCTKEDILNTRPWPELMAFFRQNKKHAGISRKEKATL